MSADFEPLFAQPDEQEFQTWERPEFDLNQQSENLTNKAELDFALECERLREEAREQGYQEGLQKAHDELSGLKEKLIEWLKLIQNPIQLLDKELSNELLLTVLWLCQHCIKVELSAEPGKILNLIEDVKLALPALHKDKQLILNPEDMAWLKEYLGESDKILSDMLCADENLGRGDFYLRGPHSELDGTLKARLQNIFNKHLPSYDIEPDEESPS